MTPESNREEELASRTTTVQVSSLIQPTRPASGETFPPETTSNRDYLWEPPSEPQETTSLDCPPTTDCYCAPTVSVPEDPSLETSCEAAASIIVGMRGHGDEEQARAELGCKTSSSCRVKNTTLFQVLDRG